MRFDPRHVSGGDVPANYVGLSVEWSLIERYMGPNACPAFVNLLHNLGTGVLRVGAAQVHPPARGGSTMIAGGPHTNPAIARDS